MELLARREHSRAELKRKLKRREFSADVIESVLDALAQSGAQSDARFVDAYIESRIKRGFGPLRITSELRERGVNASDSELRQGYDWLDFCRALRDRRFGDASAPTRREWQRRARFLYSRGFPESMVRQVLGPMRST